MRNIYDLKCAVNMLYDKTKQSRGIMDRVGVWNKAKRTKKEEKKV